jgi:hypothetical protein
MEVELNMIVDGTAYGKRYNINEEDDLVLISKAVGTSFRRKVKDLLGENNEKD